MNFSKTFSTLLAFLFSVLLTTGQTFVKEDNIINQTSTANNYSGGAWIDFDNDGDLDLHAAREHLFINNGDGTFTYNNTMLAASEIGGSANGVSWADMDNDGDLDLALSGHPISLFENNGSEFTRRVTGNFDPDSNFRGWAPAWGDYNNDGYVDLFVTHANLFHGPPGTPSFLFVNKGDGRFYKDKEFLFSNELAPYTIPTWTDYDLDGDLDLFIGSGPANGTTARDYIFINQLTETGEPDLVRLEEGPLGTDQQNGQTYNTVDFDNDGDFDVHLTNYSGVDDRIYFNDNGTYQPGGAAFTVSGARLGGNWGDTDNDGDLDLLVTSESGNTFYMNNGDLTFTAITDNGLAVGGGSRGATFGDYDGDGDLDVFVAGGGEARGLFKNENDNNNSWIKFNLEGTVSNKAAIGAKVKLRATINGDEVWLLRELLAQNSFGAHNSLEVHFGLGDATSVEEVVIEWPSGQVTNMAARNTNQTINVTEEIPEDFIRANFSADEVFVYGTTTINFTDLSISNSSDPISTWEWDFNNDGTIDATTQNPQWEYTQPGVYTVSLTISNSSGSDMKTFEDYITINAEAGLPVILSSTPANTDTTIAKDGSVSFSVTAEDTTGYDLTYSWTRNGSTTSTNNTYNYTSTIFFPAPRTDTVAVTISNPINSVSKTWYVNVVDDPNSVDEDGIPTDFTLNQNYPNPFNPSTMIKYALPRRSMVSIKVYDILGSEISTLINSEMPAGFHEIEWSADNYSSGIYFYTINAGDFSETKKMMLIK